MKVGNRDVFRTLSNVYDGAFWGQICRGHPLSTCAEFSEKLTLLTPRYARGLEMLFFRKILRTYLMILNMSLWSAAYSA